MPTPFQRAAVSVNVWSKKNGFAKKRDFKASFVSPLMLKLCQNRASPPSIHHPPAAFAALHAGPTSAGTDTEFVKTSVPQKMIQAGG